MTDGFENSSREFTGETAKKKLTTKQDAGWAFRFMGADLDKMIDGGASILAADIGVQTSNVSNLSKVEFVGAYMACQARSYFKEP